VFFTMEKEDGLVNAFLRPDGYQGYYEVQCLCFPLIAEGAVQKRPRIVNVLSEGGAGM
jgi:hypothetical protein